jgi:hypothetical protein
MQYLHLPVLNLLLLRFRGSVQKISGTHNITLRTELRPVRTGDERANETSSK